MKGVTPVPGEWDGVLPPCARGEPDDDTFFTCRRLIYLSLGLAVVVLLIAAALGWRHLCPGAAVQQDAHCERATAMHLAAQCGHTEAIDFLVKCKANLSVADDGGLTPLDYAAQSGHQELLQELERRVAADKEGGTLQDLSKPRSQGSGAQGTEGPRRSWRGGGRPRRSHDVAAA